MTNHQVLIFAGQADNVGDLAIILATRRLLTSIGISKIGVLQWVSPSTAARAKFFEEEISVILSKSLISFLKSLNSLHIIGGGQMIRNNQSIKSIILLLVRVKISKLTGGRAIAIGLGITNIERRLPQILWRKILSYCDYVCVRDEKSFANAISLGAHPLLAGDLVFLLEDLFDYEVTQRDAIVIAPCIDASENRNMNAKHILALVSEARRRYPTARLVYALHDNVLDKPAMEAISRETGLCADEVVASGQPADFAALYSRSVLTITNRFHSVIFSLKARTPVVCCNDGGKIDAATKEMGLASIKITDSADERAIAALLESAEAVVDSVVNMQERAEINHSKLKCVINDWVSQEL